MKTITHNNRRYKVVSVDLKDIVVELPERERNGQYSRLPIPITSLSPRQQKIARKANLRARFKSVFGFSK